MTINAIPLGVDDRTAIAVTQYIEYSDVEEFNQHLNEARRAHPDADVQVGALWTSFGSKLWAFLMWWESK